jgi:hypothetical protein
MKIPNQIRGESNDLMIRALVHQLGELRQCSMVRGTTRWWGAAQLRPVADGRARHGAYGELDPGSGSWLNRVAGVNPSRVRPG